jgi:hypothetical protein
MGAPRDIPVEAEIHSSVNEMVKAGILDRESIPKKGGDNPNLPNPASVVSTLKRARKNLARQPVSSEDPTEDRPDQDDDNQIHGNGSVKGMNGVHKVKEVNGTNGGNGLNETTEH